MPWRKEPFESDAVDADAEIARRGDTENPTGEWQQTPVETALEWYGLGDEFRGYTTATAYIIGDLKRYRRDQLEVLPVLEGEELRHNEIFDLPLDQIWFAAISSERVLVRVPVVFVTIFDLAAFILSPEELAEAERRVREYNTTFLPPSSDKQPETCGNIRI